MKKITVYLFAVLGLSLFNSSVMAQNNDCSRACLNDMLDQYLSAVVSNDTSKAPLFIGFRQTENAIVIPLGEGVWESVTGLGEMQRQYFDTVTGNAAYFGIVDEDGEAAVATLRLRVQNREITEAEWNIGRRDDPGIAGEPGDVLFDADYLIANPPPNRSVPSNERLSRSALIAITNSYFDGITNQNADIIQAHGGCVRLENGFIVTGRPLAEGKRDDGFEGRSDCTSGQGEFDVANVTARRFPVVDEEAQAVIASVIFLRTPGTPKWRNLFSEVFVIDEGLIRGVYAAMYYVDPLLAIPNWPPYEGNFPLSFD